VVEMPFMFDSWEQAWALLDGPVGKELVSALPAKSIRVLAFWENGFRNVTNSRRPIEKPADLQGLKIRVPNWEMSIATFKALGASVTPMAWPEVYLALQQGVVDAQENPLSIAWGAKFYEVQKFVSMTGHQYSPLPLIMSEKIWKDLSPAFQKAVQEAAFEARDYQRKLVVDNENMLVKNFLEKGMKSNSPDKEPFRKAVKVVYDQYQDRYGTWIKKLQDANREWKPKK
jgi:tripartite ATP-independent transporter DctP family solute receptor